MALGLVTALPASRLAAQCPDGTPPPCGRAAALRAPATNSVAVMYFANLSRDTADAYLADGLTDEITTRLGQVARLTVTSHTTMQRYRAGGDPQELGRALRVAHLVNGTVRRGPGRLRVGVELVRARDGVQVWTETYDRSDADVLTIEEDVARTVATAIAGRLLPDERASLATRTTRDPAAHDRLMRGNYLMNARREPEALRAVEEYRAAIALDSGYADAYARLGWAFSLFRNWDWRLPGVSSDSVIALALVYARRAVRLDSTSALAWFAEAASLAEQNILTLDGVDPPLRRALALDPRLAEAHWLRATVALRSGDPAQFRTEAHRALELEPERPITLTWLGMAAVQERRPDEARRWLDSAVAVAPAFSYALGLRAGVRAMMGDSGALTDAGDGVRAAGAGGDTTFALTMVAFAQAYVGDTAEARRSCERLLDRVRALHASAFDESTAWLAGAQLRLGQRDNAVEALSRANRTTYLRIYLGFPFFDPLRGDERFQSIVASVATPAR